MFASTVAVGLFARCLISHFSSCVSVLAGDWVRAPATGCATKCGVEAGSGTPGTVKCITSNCDTDAKPAPKACPKTQVCGAFQIQNAIDHGSVPPLTGARFVRCLICHYAHVNPQAIGYKLRQRDVRLNAEVQQGQAPRAQSSAALRVVTPAASLL